jgi:SAM-dependent methyltransferase
VLPLNTAAVGQSAFVRLPDDQPPAEKRTYAAPTTHPCRVWLQRILNDESDEDAWRGLGAAYEEMAPEWGSWVASQSHYLDPISDALTRIGRVEHAVEIGSGTGEATGLVAAQARLVLAIDSSPAMIARSPSMSNVRWILGDARSLPIDPGWADLVVGLNAVPSFREIDRVCAPSGRVLWASSFGPDTPLYVEPERFVHMLGPEWVGTARRVGFGEWCVAERRRRA